MNGKKTSVWVTAEFIGFHQWNNAPQEVSFLRNLHRHVFKVKAQVAVSHSDRDVEFFILQRDLKEVLSLLRAKLSMDSGMSCEMMAEGIITSLQERGYVVEQVEVSEDGENGAIVRI